MRRVMSLPLAAVLLLALPTVSAAGKPRPVTPSLPPSIPPVSTSDAARAHASASSAGAAPDGGDVVALVSLGVGGVGLLALSLLVARKARGPPVVRPPKRSFAAGRALGQASRVGSEAEALARLRAPAVGRVVALGAREGHVRVAVARQRGEPCELVSGYLTGLFEEAWASDVMLQHEVCSGKKREVPCEYSVIRAVPRAGEGATRESGAGTGRSRQARGGRA